jgi:hypothetical protein
MNIHGMGYEKVVCYWALLDDKKLPPTMLLLAQQFSYVLKLEFELYCSTC